ncbi:hypothetical protein B0H10DRAFT_2193615 [Mycena sp. CBHHK59/15]|nr:hypothetical protein B0H10DRAFT_2193615 [Mycena sp. CBHHK59/15]
MNTEFNSTLAALALNPRLHNRVGSCQACGAQMLALVQCLKGSTITNRARWFQKASLNEFSLYLIFLISLHSQCPHCEFFFWHDAPTPLEHIPDGVQINFALVASSKEAGTSLLCPEPNSSGSSSSLDSTAGDPSPSVVSRTFARPLDENHARGYLIRHHNVREANARLEATAKAKEASTNSVYVVLWAKEDRLPQKYTLVNKTPGKFIPAQHVVLSSALVGGCFDGFSDASVSLLELPVFIRSEPALRVGTSRGGDHYLSVLRSSRKGTSQASLESAFKTAFPQCSFKSQTVYKHLKLYDDAVKLNILATFSSAGKTMGGKRSDLAKAVEEQRKSIQPGKCFLSHLILPLTQIFIDPIVISDDDDNDELEYNIMTMKKEVFSYCSEPEGRMQSDAGSQTGPALEMDVLICDDFEKGHKIKVAMGSYSDSTSDFIVVALKKVTFSDITLWPSRDMAGWCEGARLAECQLQYSVFKSRAAVINMDCAGVDVLKTCLFTCMGVPYITQPWECGLPFSVNTLAWESGAYNILTAFLTSPIKRAITGVSTLTSKDTKPQLVIKSSILARTFRIAETARLTIRCSEASESMESTTSLITTFVGWCARRSD